jgi:hypothetical protein
LTASEFESFVQEPDVATVSAIPVDSLSILSMPQAAEPIGLVARAKAGDGSACHDLFKAHAKRVYSLSLRLAERSSTPRT